MKHPIAIAADAVGSQAALGRLLGVSKGAVWQWMEVGRDVPIIHCVAIERLTSGAVTRRDLRPNDWHLIWPELAEGSAGDSA